MSERSFGRYTVETSNEDKVLEPSQGLTKGDLMDHYERMADLILPHVKNRALSLRRFPDGIEEYGFFHKDAEKTLPDWMDTVALEKEGGTVHYATAERTADLVELGQLATVELHAFLATNDKPHYPDRMIVDLDPPGGDFDPVRRAALTLRERFEAVGLTAFTMVTGSKGMHLLVPLDGSAEFDTVRAWAVDFCQRLADEEPGQFTMERLKEKREGRIYLDVMRNSYGQTGVVPYSPRPLEGFPVATPLSWVEVERGGFGPRDWTVANIARRTGQTGDPWSGIARHAASLPE